MRPPRVRERFPLQVSLWGPAGALGALLAASVLYVCLSQEGHAALNWLDGLEPAAKVPELAVPTPAPARTARLYWLADDGQWSVQEHPAAGTLLDRVEQLSNLVLDRLALDLLVVQAIVSEDDVANLFFSVSVWEPSVQQEAFLAQSLTRTLLTDLPWLSGVRLVLPSRHLDYSRPLRHFDVGHDPLLRKSRSTLGLEVPP